MELFSSNIKISYIFLCFRKRKPREKFLIFQEMKTLKKLLTFQEMELFSLFRENFLYFRKRKPSKYFLYFLAESFSYILGNGKIEEIPYVSEGTSKALKTKIYSTSPKKVMNKFFKSTFGL